MLLLLRGGILVLWLGLWLPGGVLSAADDPTRVITDTPDYCRQLRLMVEEVVRRAAIPPPGRATLLAEQGGQMCDQGIIKGGIVRLRRALIMLREAEGNGD
jgi:hypothetical protein